jgi:hypothetical protein
MRRASLDAVEKRKICVPAGNQTRFSGNTSGTLDSILTTLCWLSSTGMYGVVTGTPKCKSAVVFICRGSGKFMYQYYTPTEPRQLSRYIETDCGQSSSPVETRPVLRHTQPPIQWVQGALSPGVKRPRREGDHSPPPSIEVKKIWIYTSTSPYAFMA